MTMLINVAISCVRILHQPHALAADDCIIQLMWTSGSKRMCMCFDSQPINGAATFISIQWHCQMHQALYTRCAYVLTAANVHISNKCNSNVPSSQVSFLYWRPLPRSLIYQPVGPQLCSGKHAKDCEFVVRCSSGVSCVCESEPSDRSYHNLLELESSTSSPSIPGRGSWG